MVESGAFEGKQEAERLYIVAQQRVEQAKRDLEIAKADLRQARANRKAARDEYDDEQRARRKPRQTNILAVLDGNTEQPRQVIIAETGLDATTVSSTLTRLRKAGFVVRDGDGFTGLWRITGEGSAFINSDAPFPKV
jgi:DNA-binding IclR family transcriptional regulator